MEKENPTIVEIAEALQAKSAAAIIEKKNMTYGEFWEYTKKHGINSEMVLAFLISDNTSAPSA